MVFSSGTQQAPRADIPFHSRPRSSPTQMGPSHPQPIWSRRSPAKEALSRELCPSSMLYRFKSRPYLPTSADSSPDIKSTRFSVPVVTIVVIALVTDDDPPLVFLPRQTRTLNCQVLKESINQISLLGNICGGSLTFFFCFDTHPHTLIMYRELGPLCRDICDLGFQ